ncbi:uncharacterized protein EV420DRAFT_1610125 [Desarmillaria tabescens]|uniref:Secreted protein n=1 Tax=Armillaria tabescens TaxID=1929756 RepID=A0AA39IW23_ARMTA|nr:uncharacterized protein EV420DRAFT_1610125 [Desarmillaria tabescens]KAK0431541.1 hypothetical protein EV420DRAFT_1610125 [Desarmillaria tabescens]
MRCKGWISSKSLYMSILLLDGSSSIFSRVAAPSYIAQPDQAHSLAPFKCNMQRRQLRSSTFPLYQAVSQSRRLTWTSFNIVLSSHSAWATPSIPHVHLCPHHGQLRDEHDTRLVGLHFEAAQTSTLQDDYRNRV